MNNTVTSILLIVFLTGSSIFGGYYLGRTLESKKVEQIEERYREVTDSLTTLVSEVAGKVGTVTQQRDSLERELLKSKESISGLKLKYEEQISKVVNYTSPELEQFFYSRYSTN